MRLYYSKTYTYNKIEIKLKTKLLVIEKMPTLTFPPKLCKVTDRIERISDITICKYPLEPNISLKIKQLITTEFYDMVDDAFFHPNHVDFINNYYCSQTKNQRRPSTFHIYQFTDV